MSYGFTLGLVCKATFEDGDERSDYCKRTAQPHVLITGHDAGDNAGNIDPSAALIGELKTFSMLQPHCQSHGFHPDTRPTLTTGMLCDGPPHLSSQQPLSKTLIKTRTAALLATARLAVWQ